MVKNASVAVETQTRIAVNGQEKDAVLLWYSSNPNAATVDKDGVVTGVSEGAAIIYCEVNQDGEITRLSTRVRVLPTITVRNQNRLMDALNSGEYGKVVYETDATGEVVFLEGDYDDVELEVVAPNLSITNYANFKQVSIRRISTNTWTEHAAGNRIAVTAPNSSLIIGDNARVSELSVAGDRCNLTIHGKVESVRADGIGQLSLKGRAGSVKIEGLQTIEVTFPATLAMSSTGQVSVVKGTTADSDANASASGGAGASAPVSRNNNEDDSSDTGSASTPPSTGGTGSGSGGTGWGNEGPGDNGSGGEGPGDTDEDGDEDDDKEGGSDPGAEVTVTSVAVKTLPETTTYLTGESLDLTGLVVTLNLSDGTSTDLAAGQLAANGLDTNPAHGDSLTTGDRTVTVTHSAGHSDSFAITVTDAAPPSVTGIAVKSPPTRTQYQPGNRLNLEGLVVTLTYGDGTSLDVPYSGFAQQGLSTTPAQNTALAWGISKVQIRHTSGHTTSFDIRVRYYSSYGQSLSIAELPDKTVYEDGEALALEGLVVTLYEEEEGPGRDVPYSAFGQHGLEVISHSQGTPLSQGAVEVTIQHTVTGDTASFHLTVDAGQSD